MTLSAACRGNEDWTPLDRWCRVVPEFSFNERDYSRRDRRWWRVHQFRDGFFLRFQKKLGYRHVTRS